MVSLIRDIVLAIAVTAGLIALMSAVSSPPAAAQDAPSTDRAATFKSLRQACGDDVRALCPGIAPGGGRIKKCLQEKSDQVSDTCKRAVAARP